MMKVTTYSDSHPFLEAVMPSLLKRESANCLALGIILRFQANLDLQKPFCLLAAVHDEDGTIILAAIHQKTYRLLLASPFQKSSLSLPAIPVLFNYLLSTDYDFNGCVGPTVLAKCFSDLYHIQTDGLAILSVAERLFECTKVISPPISVPGYLRLANISDHTTVVTWYTAFTEEALIFGPKRTHEDIAATVELAIQKGLMYVWEVPDSVYNHNNTNHQEGSSSLVSMAYFSRRVQTRASISYVYTPKEHRGKGFASHCVAALTKKALEEFQAVILYTNLANPISNYIYKKIGYKEVEDMDNWAYGTEAEELLAQGLIPVEK